MSWSVRLFGREVLSVVRCCERSDKATEQLDDLDGLGDRDVTLTAQADVAEDWRDPDAEVYLRSRRVRPSVVVVGSRHPSGTRMPFGFATVGPTASG